jgi:NitT/TauT family transport system substrate-binding protein
MPKPHRQQKRAANTRLNGAVTRRSALAGATALLTVGPNMRTARAADKLTVRLDWSTHGMHAPFFLSLEKGWFKAADLDVSFEDGNGSVTTSQLVGSGQFDIGHAALAPMAIGVSKGLAVISIAGFIRRGDTGILVPKENHWTRPSDLIGKRIVYTAGSLEGPFIRPFFEKNGVPIDKITLLNVEASAKLSTYFSRDCDAAASTVPWLIPIAEGKRDSDGILFADFGFDLPGYGLVVQVENLKKKGPALKRFASLISGAWKYILDGHEDEGTSAILVHRPQSPLSAKVLKAQIETYRPFFHTAATKDTPIGLQSEIDWQMTIDEMQKADVMPKGVKPQQIFTNDFVDLSFAKTIIGS